MTFHLINRALAGLAICTLALASKLQAQVPQLINYQGRVAVNGTNFDGNGQFKFALVDATGSTTYWSNDGSSTAGSEPTAAVAITVTKGLCSVLLGDATQPHMTIVPATVFTHADVHLRIWFNDGSNGFQLLAPDKRIAAVGYALMADSVSDGAITAAKVADGAVTSAKLADGAVTSAKLAPGVVQTSNLASGAVGNAQLANPGLTITAGTGLSGGGLVALGSSITLGNSGVLSLAAGGGITTDASTGAITLGSTATSANTAGAIVARDASGNFSAGTISAALAGNATTATSSISFTGALAGDVTGTQTATSIAATTITSKTLTGFAAMPGTLTAADTVLTALGKLDANTSLKAPLASPSFTGTVLLPAGTPTTAPLRLQSGDPLSTPAFGAVEFDGTNLFITNNSANPTRKSVAFTDSAISSAQLADGSVTSAKLAAGAVGSAQLASNLTLAGTTTGSFTGNLTGNAATATTAGSATSFTGTLAGNVTGTQAATVVASVGGVAAADVASGATLANAATDANTASTVVKRDASGNFSAGTITASLAGNASTATTATSATSFTGPLAGDVTGTQAATVVASVGGVAAADMATGASLANAATQANTATTLVKRDASGSFSAGTITASLAGNASTATSAITATNFSGSLSGDITGTQTATAIADTTITGKALTGFAAASGPVTAADTILSAFNKLSGNTALLAPLASPQFTGTVVLSAGSATIAPLQIQSGPVLTAPTFGAVEFDGTHLFVTTNAASPSRKTLAFTDSTITSAQIAVGAVGTSQLASDLALAGTTTGTFSGNGAALAALNATSISNGTLADARLGNNVVLLNTAQTLTNKTITGTFTGSLAGNASTATTASNFSGSLAGDVTGTQGATAVTSVGGISAANVATGATLANAATSANTASTTVKRDASGNFSAGTVTANLNGNASTATTSSTVTGAFAGDVTGTQGAMSISASTVTGKPLTGFVSGAGTITTADSILSAISKLDGNTTTMAATLNSLVATPNETNVYYRVFSVGSLTSSVQSTIYAPFILPASDRYTHSIYQPISTTVRHISELVAKATTTVSSGTVTVNIIRRDLNDADTTLATVQKSGAASTSTVTVNTDLVLDHTTNLYFIEAALVGGGSGSTMTTLHWVRLLESK